MKHELATTAFQFADVFHNAPDVQNVNLKDGHGNTVLDSGRHVYPGAMIGIGVALYVDVVRKKIPETSFALATAISAGLASSYEAYDACGDNVPGAKNIVDVCKAGYLDGETLKHATADSVWDILTTVVSSSVSAGIASFALYKLHKAAKHKGYYKMSQKQYNNMVLKDLTPSKKDMELITVEND